MMKKLLILFTSFSVLSLSTINTISCTKNNDNVKKNIKSKYSNFYILGDSLSDDGAFNGIYNSILNNKSFDTKFNLNKFMGLNYTVAQLQQLFNITHINFTADSKYFNIHQYTTQYNKDNKNGFTFSDGEPSFSLVAKSMGFNVVPAWDSRIETLPLDDSTNIITSQFGNDYAVGGAVAADNVENSSDNLFFGLNFKDGIYNQAKTLVYQHKNLKNSLICMDIGGNDLLNHEDYNNGYNKTELDSAISQVDKTLNYLKQNNANNIIFMDAPDISKVPIKINDPNQAPNAKINESNASNYYNNGIIKIFNKYKDSNNNWKLINLPNEFNKLIEDAKNKNNTTTDSKYWTENSITRTLDSSTLVSNLENKSEIKYSAILNTDSGVTYANKDQFLFWDYIHPNEWAYQIVKDDILKVLN